MVSVQEQRRLIQKNPQQRAAIAQSYVQQQEAPSVAAPIPPTQQVSYSQDQLKSFGRAIKAKEKIIGQLQGKISHREKEGLNPSSIPVLREALENELREIGQL